MSIATQKIATCIATLVLAVAASSVRAASTWYVDPSSGDDSAAGGAEAPWATISKALTSALSGDTVILRKGVHYYDPSVNKGTYHNLYVSKQLAIVGDTDDPTEVIVTPDPAKNNNFGAFDVNAAGCEVRNLTVKGTQFTTTGKSGMAFLVRSASSISNCVVTGCKLTYQNSGNPLNLTVSGASAIGCVVSNNTATLAQSFVTCSGGTILRDCLITGNTSDGGTIMNGAMVVSNCVIAGNVGKRALGGQTGVDMYDVRIMNNTLSECAVNGGTIHRFLICSNTCGYAIQSAAAYNCLITSNLVSGGFYNSGNQAYNVVNCTFAHNQKTSARKCMYAGTNFRMYNCVFWDNPYDTGSESGQNNATSGTNTTPEDSNLYAFDPLFRDDGYGVSLSSASPCIDAGDTSRLSSAFDLAEDFGGSPRVLGGGVDLGCCEFDPSGVVSNEYFVATNGDDTNDGRSASTAFATLDKALAVSAQFDVIRVAAGEYAITGTVTVAGQTVIGNVEAPSAVVLRNTGTNRALRLTTVASAVKGLTITRADGVTVLETGAGAYLEGGTLDHVVVADNQSNVQAPALWLANATGVKVVDCLITNNFSPTRGGGGAVSCSGTKPQIWRTKIIGNKVAANWSNGGGVAGCTLYDCELVGNSLYLGCGRGGGAAGSILYRCLVKGNSCLNMGGGLYNCTAFDCLIVGNRLESSGGGTGVYGGTCYNCTIVSNPINNTADSGVDSGCSLYNCIVWGNTTGNGSVTNNYGSGITLNYSCTWPLPAIGTGNIAVDPCFKDVAGGDYRLGTGSPCLNAGSTEAASRPVDLAGNARIALGLPDMGCYEKQALETADLVIGQDRTPQAGTVGADLVFAATITAAEGASVSIHWDFGDGTTAEASAVGTGAALTVTTSHAYQYGGAYDVTATASASGCVDISDTVPSKGLVTYSGARDLYVKPDGSNAADGLSWETAKASPHSAAVAVSADGSRIFVAPGTYVLDETVVLTNAVVLSGTGASPLDVVLTAPDSAAASPVYLGNAGAVVSSVAFVGITNNVWGGAVYINNGLVTNCVFTGNRASQALVGANNNSAAILRNCVFTNNLAQMLFCVDNANSKPRVFDTLFACNTYYNGGYGNITQSGTLIRCVIRDNSCSEEPVIYSALYDSLVANNRAGGCTLRAVTAYNCTVVGNAGNSFVRSGAFYNCIAYANTNSAGAIAGAINNERASAYNSLVESTIYLVEAATNAANGNMIGVDPRLKADYTLRSDSPCVNPGVTNATYFPLSTLRATDLNGNPRIVGKTVDLGCYECQSVVGGFVIRICDNKNLTVPYGWVTNACPQVAADDAAAVSNALVSTGANGRVRWESYALGLDPNKPSSVVLCDAAQDAAADTVTFHARNVSPATNTAFTVDYVLEGSKDGGLTWPYERTSATNVLQVALPTEYTFFRIRTDIVFF